MLSTIFERYLETYEVIKRKHTFTTSSFQILAAWMLATAKLTYDHDTYKALKKQFNKGGGFSLSVTSLADELLIIKLIKKGTQSSRMVDDILVTSKALKTSRLPFGSQLHLCSFELLERRVTSTELEEIGSWMSTQFTQLKKWHPFITTQNELRLLQMAAEKRGEEPNISEKAEAFYKALQSKGFKAGETLLQLALSLTLLPVDGNLLVEQCHMVNEAFRSNRKTLTGEQYFAVSLLVSSNLATDSAVQTVMEDFYELKKIKASKWWSQNDRLMIAVLNHIQTQMNQQQAVDQKIDGIQTVWIELQYLKAMQQMATTATM